MKTEFKKIFVLFLWAIVVYGIIVSLFTSTVHIDVDEELYLALARSFHYRGRFEYGNQLLNYNCVLYSILISLAYYFYSPKSILFVMRMIGVIVMCSSVFPIYLLAKKVIKDEKTALLLSGLMMIMPYMFDCAYLMQEVLSYPLFIWTVYFLCQAFESERSRIFLVLGAVFSVLCVFTKTYMFFIPITLNLSSIYYALSVKNKKEYIFRIVLYDLVYLLLFSGMYFGVFAINGFQMGSNHYSNQFSRLFPIGRDTLVYGVLGCIIYAALFMINIGIFPIGAVLYKQCHEKEKSWITNFTLLSVVFLIVEVVFMVVLTEQGAGTLPWKFLFRYFQIFVPIIYILFVKYKEDISFLNSFGIRSITYVSLFVALIYFVYMKGQTRQAIIDGHIFLFIENVTKYILPYADAIIIVLLMLIALILFYVCGRKLKNVQPILVIGTVGMILFWFIEAAQLPYYNNVIAEGKAIQSDSIKIAEYLNKGKYEYVYYVYENLEEKDSYLRNFYGYIKQPYEIISQNDLNRIISHNQNSRVAFLMPQTILNDKSDLNMVQLNNKKLHMYIVGE